MRVWLVALVVGVLVVGIAGCAAAPRQTPPPAAELIPGPILTFRFQRGVGGNPVLRTLEAAVILCAGCSKGTKRDRARWPGSALRMGES